MKETEVSHPILHYPDMESLSKSSSPVLESQSQKYFWNQKCKNTCNKLGVNLQTSPQGQKISLSNILTSCPKVLSSFVMLQNDKEMTLRRRENSTISYWRQKVLHNLHLGTKFAELCCKASPGFLTSLTLGGHLNPATVPVITLFTVLDSGIVRSWEDTRDIRKELTTRLSGW